MSNGYELRRFTDPNNPTDENMSYKDSGGCYVKTATGFVLGLLTILIAVGVGLIVHFAENRSIECVFPDQTAAVVSGGQLKQDVGGPCPEVSTVPAASCPTCPATTDCRTTPQPSATTRPSANTTATTPSSVKRDVRLPRDLLPIHYTLTLQPEMYNAAAPETFTFAGHVSIELECTKATDMVILHVNELQVQNLQFDGNGLQYTSHSIDADRQELTVRVSGPTTPGVSYTLSMDFNGPLKDDLKGFYLSSYMEDGHKVYLATTQFESTDARKAFPCFDEPDLKATFAVTLTRKQHLMTLSNMPIKETHIRADGYVDDVYETSAKMSTYLLAFVIGQFNSTSAVANNDKGLPYGAWARPASVEATREALYVGVNTIVNYEKYFDILFPLPKQDMIAIPDFSAGAMENWGLITYRETAMLFTPGVSSEVNKQRVTVVITHELAHQWFGDLVTMEWWDDLWLNEGFATFVEYLGADMLHPDWQMFEQFVHFEIQDAFEFDSLVTSHPIYVPVNGPEEITEIFDAISYEKGGSIIRMMRFILGEETFKNGLTRYLNEHSMGNAVHNDLWRAWQEQSAIDTPAAPVAVAAIMDTWTLQMNYPVVNVEITNGQLHVTQSRFLKNMNAQDPGKYPSTFGYKWQIPFTYTTSKDPRFDPTNADIHWLKETSLDIGALSLTEDEWVIGNVQQYGFYRVTYTEENWRALVKQLKIKHTVISSINRAQIINDAWSLSRAGQLSIDIALSTLEYLDKELDYVPWLAAITQIDYLDEMLRKTDMYGDFQAFMLSKLSSPFRHFGMDDTNATHVESLIRGRLVNLACGYGMTACVTEAQKLFQQWMNNPDNNPIDPDIRPAVYCTGVGEGGRREWEFLLNMYMQATVATEKVTLSRALACTRETWLLSRYLEMSIDSDIVRKQDATKVLIYIGSTATGQPLAWDFVRGEWEYLLNTYGKGFFSFASLIGGITSSFNTDFQLAELDDFQSAYSDMGTGNRAFQQAKEKTETNIEWMKASRRSLATWLQNVGTTEVTRVKDVRLPLHLVPESYDITLQPNMYEGDKSDFTFDGYVKIYMEAASVGRNVTLHTNKLTISEDSIVFGKVGGGEAPKYTGQRQHDALRQFEIFYLDSKVVPGQYYFIEMNFTGPLVGDLAGLYLSQYMRGNDTVYMATTQFEPTDARKAFPCFDEPQLKAEFRVKLVRKQDMVSISNMPIISHYNIENDMVVDVYNVSAKMSTYLLAFIVCDFEYTEDRTTNGITYRAWARPELINQTKVALDVGTRILTFYEEYFGAEFPLPKQDMIAVPDFSAGAMENWGLITYRESIMLYEPGVSSRGNLQTVNVVIAHELAHMWFGDLVTMEWWDDLWLNEGFASFVEFMGTDHVHPEWKMFEQFVTTVYNVFNIDSLVTSHPIYVPVQNPDEINEIFDAISYDKGGAVIRMMRFFLGEETFKQGIQDYIQERKFKNAFHDDLWDALDKKAQDMGNSLPSSVKDILDTWILQMNYPVVMVTRTDNGKIHLRQDRFLKNGDAQDPGIYTSPFNYKWQVPFTYTTGDAPDFNVTASDVIWLVDKEEDLDTHAYPASSWILGNVEQYGVYRVNYENDNWLKLIQQLKDDHTVISTINRGQIINDAFGLARAKQLPMETALQTVEYLDNEQDYIPWYAAKSELSYINRMLHDTPVYGQFQSFMRAKLQTQFERLTMNDSGDGHLLESYLRSSIASSACYYGNKDCIEEAQQLLKMYMNNPSHNPIDPALKSTVYCTTVREGGEREWQFIFDRYMDAEVQAEKRRLLSALSCTRKIWILKKMLNLALDDSVVRSQDIFGVFDGIGSNPVGRPIAWDFFMENWDMIFEKYATGFYSFESIVGGVAHSYNTEYQLQQLKDFGKAHPDIASGTRAYSQMIESVMSNIQWMNENYDVIVTWLNSN